MSFDDTSFENLLKFKYACVINTHKLCSLWEGEDNKLRKCIENWTFLFRFLTKIRFTFAHKKPSACDSEERT
jgi:hypothetical protein